MAGSTIAEPFDSALALAAAIRERKISPLEAMDTCLDAVAQCNPELNAVIWCDEEAARRDARDATDILTSTADPSDLPPFLGVPIPIKDLTAVEGWPTTYGSNAAPSAPSALSELVASALSRAGFVLAGRTNTPELGSITVTENLRYGITRNPWDTERTPGGSSGGAAAVVASGCFPAAHGNDGGGSIRIPAACCGLVGLKASRARVPSLARNWEGAAVEGVLARTIADAAAILDAISYLDPFAWENAPRPARPFQDEVGAPLDTLRIAYLTETPLGMASEPQAVSAVEEVALQCERLGHRVVELGSPLIGQDEVGEYLTAFIGLVSAGVAEFDLVDYKHLEPQNRAAYEAAEAMSSIAYRKAVLTLERISRLIVQRWTGGIDVLITPTIPIEPPLAGDVLAKVNEAGSSAVAEVVAMASFTSPFNVTGQPAISLPTAVSPNGLPTGVQLVGGPWGEARLIRLASALETTVGWQPWAEKLPQVYARRS